MLEAVSRIFRKLLNRTVFRRDSDSFTIQQRTIEEREQPPGFSGVIVSQNGYGVSISKKPGQGTKNKRGPKEEDLLSTISACHLIHLAQPSEGVNVLAHLDPGMDNITPFYRMVSHLVEEGILKNPRFAKSSILLSSTTGIEAVEKTYLTLHALGCRPQVLRCVSMDPRGISGVTAEGRLARYKHSPKIAELVQVGHTHWKKRDTARASRTLFYNNEGKFTKATPFQIYLGVPAFVYNEQNFLKELNKRMQKKPQNPFKLWSELKKATANKTGEYAFNIPLEKDFDLDESRIEREAGVEVKRMKCKQGEYLHIGATEKTGELKPKTVQKVQNVFFSVARQIAEHHEKQGA